MGAEAAAHPTKGWGAKRCRSGVRSSQNVRGRRAEASATEPASTRRKPPEQNENRPRLPSVRPAGHGFGSALGPLRGVNPPRDDSIAWSGVQASDTQTRQIHRPVIVCQGFFPSRVVSDAQPRNLHGTPWATDLHTSRSMTAAAILGTLLNRPETVAAIASSAQIGNQTAVRHDAVTGR
ncbi:MAG: hypothetical protein ACFBRM_09145 [Pikeienuella sp.]